MKPSTLRLLIAWLCMVSLALPVLGQAPAASGDQSPPVLRVTTRLVQVSVIVQDKKGEPVTDLTRNDFELLDNGKEQAISVFSVETSQPPAPQSQPLSPNMFSNRLEYHAGTPTSVTVILLDGLNTRFEDQAYARGQLIKFLQQLHPQDRVALYTLGRDLRVLHDFTSDAAPLLRALARYKGRVSPELDVSEPAEPDTGIAELDAWLANSSQQMSDFYIRDRVRRTLNAIEAIANHLSRLPGRKNLVWVSGSFPYSIGFDVLLSQNPTREQRTFSPEIGRASQALSNANVAIYPVDARGLIALPVFSADQRKLPSPERAMSVMRSIDHSHDTMRALAEGTGGRAFYNSNDINGGIRRAIEDSRVTYVLGYYPTHGKWDGKFHEIKVKTKRPSLNVRYRRGYFAFSAKPQDEKQRRAALDDAVWSPLDATGIGLTVRVEEANAETKTLKVVIQVDPRDVTLQEKDHRWIGSLDVLFVPRTTDGRQLKGTSDTLNMQLKRETYEQVVQKGLVLTKHVSIAADAYQLRVVVRDQTSGALGSVSIPLSQFQPKRG